MSRSTKTPLEHPGSLSRRAVSRRTAIQAGTVGLLGLGIDHLQEIRAAAAPVGTARNGYASATSCIYIFLSGGLGQHDSFDMKPDAPDTIRGEFNPISTSTPGIQICEHLPLLAQRSHLWALCRSLTHPRNEHSEGHMIMLTGRTELPRGFSPGGARPSDWPSMAAIAGDVIVPRNNLPPAVVLPEKLVHRTGRVIPGQLAGEMGWRRDPWLIEASPFCSTAYGAYPEYEFHHADDKLDESRVFAAPRLALPQGVDPQRLGGRLELLADLDRQRRRLEEHAAIQSLERYRQRAISLVTESKVRSAMDVTTADDRIQDRYGRNSFGWSLLMARRLVEAGVNLVQVNLGNNEAWDTHGNAFPHLKDNLFPPTDRAVSALLDDLHERGLLDQTLIVMAGEFGRTPKLSTLTEHYQSPGRDHWGASQTVFFAGGGVQGGNVIGSTDKIGAYPDSDPQRPENMAATIYRALGIPATGVWRDELDRPHTIYHGQPIEGLV